MITRVAYQDPPDFAAVAVAEFEKSARHFGLLAGAHVSYRARASVRHAAFLYDKNMRFYSRLSGTLFVTSALLSLIEVMGFSRYAPALPNFPGPSRETDGPPYEPSIAILGIGYTLLFVAAYFHQRFVRGRQLLNGSLLTRRRSHALPFLSALLVDRCYEAQRSSLPKRATAFRQLGRSSMALEAAIQRLARDAGMFGRRNARTTAAKKHAALVCAALRKASSRIDADPDQGLQQMAELAMKITERYADRRWGALLDDADLANLEPVRSREFLRLVAAAVLTAAAALGISLLNPPAAVLPVLIGAIGLVSMSAIYGPRAHGPLDLLDAVRGVQRP